MSEGVLGFVSRMGEMRNAFKFFICNTRLAQTTSSTREVRCQLNSRLHQRKITTTTLNTKPVGKYDALVCTFIQLICILLFNGGDISSLLLLFVCVSFLVTTRYILFDFVSNLGCILLLRFNIRVMNEM